MPNTAHKPSNNKSFSRRNQNHYDGSKDRNPVMQYVPSGKGNPIRYENLRPDSHFTIFAEPSRRIRTSTDKDLYHKALVGFYAERCRDKQGCVLMPNDLVVPHRLVRISSAD